MITCVSGLTLSQTLPCGPPQAPWVGACWQPLTGRNPGPTVRELFFPSAPHVSRPGGGSCRHCPRHPGPSQSQVSCALRNGGGWAQGGGSLPVRSPPGGGSQSPSLVSVCTLTGRPVLTASQSERSCRCPCSPDVQPTPVSTPAPAGRGGAWARAVQSGNTALCFLGWETGV